MANKYPNCLAVIPARGGSKGLPRKSIKQIAGLPMIAYSILAALEAECRPRVIVSTDDDEIAEIAKYHGAEVPFMRPDELATDECPTLPVLQHALNYLKESEGYEPDTVILLQPTSPLRKSHHIDEAVKKLINSQADSIISLVESKSHPFWLKVIEDDRAIDFCSSDGTAKRRQDLPKVYQPNGALYVTRYQVIMKENSILGEYTLPYIMAKEYSADIDDAYDFLVAELLLLKEQRENADFPR